MRQFSRYVCALVTIPVLACGGAGSPSVDDAEVSVHDLRGPYLGQPPPGLEPVLFAPGVVSTGSHELSITFSPDGEEVFFFAAGPTYDPGFILHSRLEGGVWTAPREASFSDPGRTDSYPFVTPNGSRVFFGSRRSSRESGEPAHPSEIWFVENSGPDLAAPQKIDFGGDLGGIGTFPSVAANGNLYFSGSHESASPDIYVSRYHDGRYATPENLGPAVNSDAGEYHAFIAPDESYLLFDSQREEGSLGRSDLFISRRQENGSWSQATNLGPAVNTPFSDLRPFVSADGRYLFFASNRTTAELVPAGTQDFETIKHRLLQPGNGLQDIYWVSAEVIRESLNE